MTCPSCGAENRQEAKFCASCGSPLARTCPNGHPVPADARFCDECGAAVQAGSAPAGAVAPATTPAAAPPARAAERRLVSILFADLVGFTTASEDRDPEETRELLSRYFDEARTRIERYGGTVEKFIGDAVMAVWGTPIAQEDDAERAVRAALDLIAAIPDLHPALQARAAVLTGEAAVTLGAEGQGMVAGDLVNAASRVQSLAEPGTVLVGDATRRATEAAIAYEEAGRHELRGRAEPVHLSRALRVVANRGGERRSQGLEAPFVGRERELRLVKELFHGSAAEGRAHFVLVTGIAGIGKSRLAWEFEKYADGLTQTLYWHRGRCLAYGEGVAYWALAEMVRSRARIVENEDPESAATKLAVAVEEHIRDAQDREWVESRLGHLLGLGDDPAPQREDLFGAWRLFFESLADENPVALVFEDLQWADAGLLDFVEYLLEWARSKPIFVIGLARPELGERRPGFGASARGFTALALEPISADAMDELLEGLVPGLPDELRDTIRARAEGVPLYAVETVRMLLDRGQLERAEDAYRVVGDVKTLAVPETLHALVASRLDGLTGEERRVVQDAAILGKTFTQDALAAVSGQTVDELDACLQSLVRKEILFREADPRSPERGHYGFLQDLVRHVAYETLARRDRKSRHLAAARFYEESWGGREQEVVEVVASHYLTALELEPQADDAPELRLLAREMLARAAERAASLGASAEAAASFARAAELAESGPEQGRLLVQAGNATRAAGDPERASELLARAIALLEDAGDRHTAARASANLAQVDFGRGRLGDAIDRMERAYAVLEHEEPDEDLAFFMSQLARHHYFVGNYDLAQERNERALEVAERLRLPEVLSHALNTAGLLASQRGRPETARALVGRALEIALESDLPVAAARGYTNLAAVTGALGNIAELQELTLKALELARRIGDREGEWFSLGNLVEGYVLAGRWDEAEAIANELPKGLETQALGLHAAMAFIACQRGDPEAAARAVERIAPLETSASLQDRSIFAATKFSLLMAEGRYDDALELASRSRSADLSSLERWWFAIAEAEAAAAAGLLSRVNEAVGAVEALPPGETGPLLRAQAARFRAIVAASQGDRERAESSFKAAAATFREYGTPFLLACTQLDYAQWLSAEDRSDEATPLLDEARETFEELRAAPWLERAERARRTAEVAA